MLSEEVFKKKINECVKYFEKPISKEKTQIYWDHLKDRYTDEHFIRKIDYILKWYDKFPTIGDIGREVMY